MLSPTSNARISAAELTQNEIKQYQYEEQQRQLSNTLTSRANNQKGKWYGSCVVGVRQFLNLERDKISGRAKDFKTTENDPTVGAIVKLNMSRYGHVGVVLSYTEDEIIYYDTNGSWNGRAAIRTIPINDSRILGYEIAN